MPIPQEHQRRFVYHFTHLGNLAGIVCNGLLAPNEQVNRNLTHKTIALQNIQDRRASMVVTCGPGGVVHDYVPFYFCTCSSMLLNVIHAKNVDQLFLVYLAIPISVVDRDDVVFTSASANTSIPPEFFCDSTNLNRLNWPCIDSRKWSWPNEQEKQARMAEVLIHRRVDIAMVDHIIVWNAGIKKDVEQIFSDAGVRPPTIAFDRHNNKYYYFTTFYEKPVRSIVTGPHFTKVAYNTSVEQILKTGQAPSAARFHNASELLEALRNDLGCLPETAELIGLESDNEVHQENVEDHTLSVVRELTGSEEFAALSEEDRQLVELAAFLHDIGKGPKARWASNKGKQKVDPDHPIKSAKMLVRILTQEVATIEPRAMQIIG